MTANPTTLSELIVRQAQALGDKDAFVYLLDGESRSVALSFAALDRRARALAVALRAHARPGDRVLLVVPPGLDYLLSLFGCWHAGVVAVPVYPPDPRQPQVNQAVMARVAENAGVCAVVAPAMLAPLLDGHLDGLPRLAPEAVAEALAEGWEAPALTPDDLAVLLYTSGSTGVPKGVMLSHGNLLHNALAMGQGCRVDSRDVFCTWLPPYHSSGLFAGIALPLYLGATNVTFSPLQFVERPARWLHALSRHGVTMAGSPTFAFDLASHIPDSELAGIDLSAWRVAVVGGEPVRADALDRFTRRYAPYGFKAEAFYSMFGLTESTMISTGAAAGQPLPRVTVSRAGLSAHQALAPVDATDAVLLVGSGRALQDMAVRVVSPDSGEAQADGQVGEIWVSGPSVAKGYWNRPDLSAAAFGARLANAPAEGPFLRTGDFGFLRDGELYVTGRLKELIIIRGLNHYPEDLERTAMGQHPGPPGCACAAFALTRDGEERLGLAIELPGGAASPDALATLGAMRAAIAQQHGVQVAEAAFVEPGALPRTATRKVQRSLCAQKVMAGEWLTIGQSLEQLIAPVARFDADALADLGAAERARAIAAHLIGLIAGASGQAAASLSPDTPIAHTGLDSLAAVKLANSLGQDFGRPLPIALFLDGSTIAEVAAFLADGGATFDAAAIDFAAEARVDLPAIAARPAPERPVLLLTGATGYLGGYLLIGLLKRQPLDVVCLVRAADDQAARERVLANVAGLPGWEPALADRIRAEVGDLAQSGLGLSGEARTRLTASVSAIVHNGASVNFVSPYASLRGANVGSVAEVLTLACEAGGVPVHFVSTVGVFNAAGRHALPRLREDFALEDPRALHGGYAQSKWVAERLLRAGRAHGLDVRIYRSGLIGAHSVTGHPHTDDFLCRMIKGCIQLGAYPALGFDLDVTPVDYVADAIVELALKPAHGEGTYHLANPVPIAFDAFLGLVAATGYPMRPLPLDAWLAAIGHDGGPDNALYALLPFLTEKLTPERLTFLEIFAQGPCPGFDRTAAAAGLDGSAVHCATIDQALVRTYTEAWLALGFLPSPAVAHG